MKERIFVSATSKGLLPYRAIVRDVLAAQGFDVDVQESFDTPGQPIRIELQERISTCRGMIALVGPYYGSESSVRFEGMQLSYTQYELVFAKKSDRQILAFIASGDFKPDENEKIDPEHPELAERQLDFIKWIKRHKRDIGYTKFSNRLELALGLAKTDWRNWRSRH